MTVPNEHQLASRVLLTLMEHQRLVREGACTSRPCEECVAVHRERVARFIAQRQPIEFVLPAFPGKSPNISKVLGPLPDMAEELSLTFLHQLCVAIEKIYSPGARIIICSDGRVFGDVVGIKDSDVTRYQERLIDMIDGIGPETLELFNLDEVFPGQDYDTMRGLLMDRYGEDLEELKQKVRTEQDALTLYRGLTRFLLEDAEGPHYQGTRAALQRDCRKRAYLVMQRSRVWGNLVAERFPEAVRLSIHPQRCGSTKFGIHLVKVSNNWATPWHSAAVEVGGQFILMKRRQADEMGAELVYVDGRPSHYIAVEPASRFDEDLDSLAKSGGSAMYVSKASR